mgnify:FL=1
MDELEKKKIALVTGAASGIGAALVRQLVADNCDVLGVDLNEEGLTKVAAETGCEVLRGDISDQEFNETAVAKVSDLFGSLDLLFLNAGILGRKIELQINDLTLDELDPSQYTKVRAINFDSVVFGTLAASKLMMANGGGSIIATASIAGLAAWNRDPFYTATKHAVVGWVRGIAPTLQTQGISINAICPGGVATPLVGIDRLESANPNLLEPEQVAKAMIETALEEGTGKAFTVKADHEPIRQQYHFTQVEGFPV